jgi:3-oxoacid CoA-transferase subunit A
MFPARVQQFSGVTMAHPSSKVRTTTADAFADLREKGVLHDGMTVMVGGFGLCGIPEHLILALRDSGVQGITCVSNNAGVDDWGLGLLLQTRQIKKMISSYVGENETFERQFIDGDLEVEFNPQGTLAERIRAGGAGIPAFYTATGAGTAVAEGKETRAFYRPVDDTKLHNRHPATMSGSGARVQDALLHKPSSPQREYVMETGLFADLALVKAYQADPFGNLTYRMTARNFNPMMATAARFVIAEVDELVDLGALDPDSVHTPGSYVDRVVRTVSQKRIERRTVQESK